MAVTRITINDFLLLAQKHPVLDVRSPGEFAHAHVPGAHAFPLFSDEERKVVGTAYKQQGRQPAIKIGLEYFGPKMVGFVEEATRITNEFYKEKQELPSIIVHCWRGGMRSSAVAWLLDLYGFKVYTLAGGYKTFRNWALAQFEKTYNIRVIGGYTGSNKTGLIQQLQKLGQKAIDLEGIASHKGSAFGALGMEEQTSQEMFENRLAVEIWRLELTEGEALFLEDESRAIGRLMVPRNFFEQLRNSPVFFIDVPFEERLKFILGDYGQFDVEPLTECVQRIQKRLGPLETKTALAHLAGGDIEACFRILLWYYDKLYRKGLGFRTPETVTQIELTSTDAVLNAAAILEKCKQTV